MLADPVALDPQRRDDEIVLLLEKDRAPTEDLRLAELELDRARTISDEWRRFRACEARPPCQMTPPPRPDPALFEGAFARFSALLEAAPDTPGLDDAVVRLAVPDRTLWHAAGFPHGEQNALVRIEAWAALWPKSDSVVAAELLLFEAANAYCHNRGIFETLAERLVGHPALHRVVALEERLAHAHEGGLADFERWLRVTDTLIDDAEGGCERESPDYACQDPRIARERAWIHSVRTEAVPVYRASLEARFDPEVASSLFWIQMEREDYAGAEAVALTMESAGAHEAAMRAWSYLVSWDLATEPVARAREDRAREHTAALAEALGQGHMIDALADKLCEDAPALAASLYLRVLAVGDRGGSYLYAVPAPAARERVLRQLATVWRFGGADEAARAWFAAQNRLDVWERELAFPEVAPRRVDNSR